MPHNLFKSIRNLIHKIFPESKKPNRKNTIMFKRYVTVDDKKICGITWSEEPGSSTYVIYDGIMIDINNFPKQSQMEILAQAQNDLNYEIELLKLNCKL